MAALDNSQSITALYVAAFGRAPDQGGLAYWNAQMDAGLTFDEVISSFLLSKEATLMVGPDIADQGLLNSLYQNALSRSPDIGGGQYWQGRLDSLQDRAVMIHEFIDAIVNGTGSDQQLLQNKLEVGQKFAASVSGNNLVYAKAMLTYVTSDAGSLTVAQAINNYFDNPVVAPATPKAISFEGRTLGAFSTDDTTLATFTVGSGDEWDIPNSFNQIKLDVNGTRLKIYADMPVGASIQLGGTTLSIVDANNVFKDFKDVNVLNVGDGATRSIFTVTDKDTVTIDISGIAITSTGFEFSILG
ncbi:DUF4214 domain-containing protein [Pseudomonas sp. 21LCFQ02]|uniref:DUF4214 domain-containing protein n=1 Tax=Pseudomonas sp. 21LCFQ02 TaxID=2957505 RepID=UPI00209AC5DD|nr:DUF4214 domain-containing protein [Pseudomonas sp. 21LCFQ02]MCO8170729.1 DUF4214 domain-containing protein [Pseudomonas sp. 21LCFQ02]